MILNGIIIFLLAFLPFFYVETAYDTFEIPKRFLFAVLLMVMCVSLMWRYLSKKQTNGVGFFVLMLPISMCIITLLNNFNAGGIYHLVVWMLPILFFYICSQLEYSEKEKDWFLLVLFFCGLVQSLIMISQALGIDQIFGFVTNKEEYFPARMIGTIGYQNQAAEFLALSLSGIFFVKGKLKKYLLCLSPIIVGALVLTINRGAILGLSIAVCCVLLFLFYEKIYKQHLSLHKKQKIKLSIVGTLSVLIIVLLIIFVDEFRTRVSDVLDFRNSVAVKSRLYMWEIACDMIKESPVFGHGAGSYAYEYLDRLGVILPNMITHNELQSLVFAEETHNDLLQFFAEFGLSGILLLFVVCYKSLKNALVNKSRTNNLIVFVFVFVFMLFCSMFSFSWQSAVAGPLAGMLLGVFSSDKDVQTEGYKGTKGVVALFIVVLLSSISLFVMVKEMKYNSDVVNSPIIVNEETPCYKRGKWISIDGAAVASNKNYVLAEKILKSALEDYVDISVYSNLGNVLYKQGKYLEALQVYEKWGKTKLLHYESLRNQILVNEKLGNYKVVADLETYCFDLFNQRYSDRDVYIMAMRYLRAEQYDNGCKILIKFRTRKKQKNMPGWTAEYANLLGAFLLKNGQVVEARNFFIEALELNPNLESARKNLEAINK